MEREEGFGRENSGRWKSAHFVDMSGDSLH